MTKACPYACFVVTVATPSATAAYQPPYAWSRRGPASDATPCAASAASSARSGPPTAGGSFASTPSAATWVMRHVIHSSTGLSVSTSPSSSSQPKPSGLRAPTIKRSRSARCVAR